MRRNHPNNKRLAAKIEADGGFQILSHESVLPSAAELKALNEVEAGTAKIIIDEFIKENKYKRTSDLIGLASGVITAFSMIIIAAYAVYIGNTKIAALAISAPFAGAALYGFLRK